MVPDEKAASKPGLVRRLFGGARAPEPAAPQAETPTAAGKGSWWQRLRGGLSRTSSAIGTSISDLVSKRKLDAATLDDLEDILIQADLGAPTASRIVEALRMSRFEKGVDAQTVKRFLADEIERALAPVARPLVVDGDAKPFVILVVGVNGSGKTTTIGKLAGQFAAQGKSVALAAGDTFRAAAIAQIRVWAERTGASLIAREQGADVSGLAYDAMVTARAEAKDVLIIDTAGRLQNRAELMAELEKIVRVLKKADPQAPHAVLLVIDATVGQNALGQVEVFGRVAGVTGLVVTKLDGTARGGILVAIAEKYRLPVHFIGVGETLHDLEPVEARDFARAIAGLDEHA